MAKHERKFSKREKQWIKRKTRKENQIFLAVLVFNVIVVMLLFDAAAVERTIQASYFGLGVALVIGLLSLWPIKLVVGYYKIWQLSKTHVEDFDRLLSRYPGWLAGKIFEYRLKTLLEVLGFSVKMTAVVWDFGADLIAEKGTTKYSVQAKCWKNKVDVNAIQQAMRGQRHYDCNAAMVITNSYFIGAARALGQSRNVVLVDRIRLSAWLDRVRSILVSK